jgi:hypothetical protein
MPKIDNRGRLLGSDMCDREVVESIDPVGGVVGFCAVLEYLRDFLADFSEVVVLWQAM